MDSEQEIPRIASRFLSKDPPVAASASQTEKITTLLSILNLSPKERSQVQMRQLGEHMKGVKFFKDLVEKEGQYALTTAMQYLGLQGGKAGQFLFHSGEEGTRFYVILTGSIAVLAPYRRKDGKRDFNLLTVLRAGECFGELALISNKPRAASIFVRETSHFGVLERHDYHRILGKIQEERLAQKVELLHRHPAFTNWSKTSLQKVSYFFKEQCFKWKQVLCRAGQPADFVFLIKSGDFQLYKSIRVTVPRRIQLTKELETAVHSAELTLLTIGEMIGDQEVIAGKGYTYTVLCASAEGEVLAVPKMEFMQRIVNEESTECLHALSQLKEKYRRDRLSQLSRLEARKWSSTLPTPLKDFSPGLEKEPIDPLKIVQARTGLEAAVRKRWDLPHRRVGSLALDKAQTTEWLKSPARSAAGSPKPFSKEFGRRSAALILPKKNQHSWLRLVTAKYFSDQGNLGVIFHKLKEPEPPQSLDISHHQRTVSSSAGKLMHRPTLITEPPVE